MMSPYPAAIETQMQRYYQSLSEKDRRRYAGIEAAKLGYGGISAEAAVPGSGSPSGQHGQLVDAPWPQ